MKIFRPLRLPQRAWTKAKVKSMRRTNSHHEQEQLARPNRSTEVCNPPAIDPAIYTEFPSSTVSAVQHHNETNSFVGDWEGQEAAYLEWPAEAGNGFHDHTTHDGTSPYDNFRCVSGDELESLLNTPPSQPEQDMAELSAEIDDIFAREERRQIWKKEKSLKTWKKQVEFLYLATNCGIWLKGDDLVPWAPLMEWLATFPQAWKVNKGPAYIKLGLLRGLEDGMAQIMHQCEADLVMLCRSNSMNPCEAVLKERLRDLDRQVQSDCLEHGCLLNVKELKGMKAGGGLVTSPF